MMGIKRIGTARLIESAAQAKAGATYHNGAIYVSIEEEGFTGDNLVYCRYGLPIPFYKVQVGEKVWVEPTYGKDNRWIYSGLVDATGTSPTEPFILGIQLKNILDTWKSQLDAIVTKINANNVVFGSHTHAVTTAPGTTAPPVSPMQDASNVDSIPNGIKSEVIFGK